MKERIITIIVGLGIFLPLIWIGSWPLALFILALGLVGFHELNRMKGINSFSFPGIVGFLGVSLVVLREYLIEWLPNSLSPEYLIVLIVLLLLISTVVDATYDFEDAALNVLGIIYIGFGFYSFIQIREASLHMLALLLLTIWSTDTGAYLVGRKIGKHKLAPTLSPNKTIEGSVGGTVSAVILTLIYTMFVNFQYHAWIMILIVMILSIAAQFGDLIESALKRHFEIKDSGDLLPGHGGILDRFDSLLFVFSLALLLGLA